jgi:D-alanyl-D-alanine carboxypeptidase
MPAMRPSSVTSRRPVRVREATPRAVLLGALLLVLTATPSIAGPGLLASGPSAPPPDLPSAVASLLAQPSVSADPSPPAEAPGSEPPRLPRCEYRDDLTRFRSTKDWERTLLDTNLRLRRSYAPRDLVPVSRAGLKGEGLVRELIIDDLAAMATAARKAGKPLAVRSAYRSYQTQVATFAMWVERSGYEQALLFSARPGHSEHQLGTTIDFTTAPGAPLSGTFGESPSGTWLARHGWEYGFIMSYPKGQRRVSCYGHEPWHWRYVGRDLARRIHESGQVPRRFLWQTFESAP